MINELKSTEAINSYLCDKDKVFKRIITNCESVSVHLNMDYYNQLVKSVIGQQLSNKIAYTIFKRLLLCCENKLEPRVIFDLDKEILRSIGISYSKIDYIKNLSVFFMENPKIENDLSSMTNEEVINKLTSIKGIGIWTAEMFLIFSLGREDVYSLRDGGLKRATQLLYSDGEIVSQKDIVKITEKWKPYRSIASLYLWKMLDNKYI